MMRSPLALLLCAAAVFAAPVPDHKGIIWLPTTTTPPPLPIVVGRSGTAINSKLTQVGHTSGGAVVSSTGSTQGSSRFTRIVAGPGGTVQQAGAGSAGVSGTSVSSGHGVFVQRGQAKTTIKAGPDGIDVKTGTQGEGFTDGTAGNIQKAGAGGGATQKQTVVTVVPKGHQLVAVVASEESKATSSSGHEASSTGPGSFKTINLAGTGIALTPLPNPLGGGTDVTITSKQKQGGRTTHGGALSATGATKGSVKTDSSRSGGGVQERKAAAASSGAAGTAASAGNGDFFQDTVAKTQIVNSEDGLVVKTGTKGTGKSGGKSGIQQTAGAAGVGALSRVVIVTLPNGKRVVRIVKTDEAKASSNQGHQASSTGDGAFSTINLGGTEIKLDDPLKG
nr:CP19k-like protein 5 [Chthamalus malayensis]